MLAMALVMVSAQYSNEDYSGSPVPPRPVIPGAISLDGPPRRPTFRAQPRRYQAPLDADQAPIPVVAKVRRPNGRTARINNNVQPSPLPPIQNFQQLEERPIAPRPVVEEPEDQPAEQSLDNYPDPALVQGPGPSPQTLFTQTIFPKQQAAVRPPKPAAAFRPERPAFIPTPTPDVDFPVPSRQQYRTTVPPAHAEPQYTRPQQQQQQQQNVNRVQQVVRNQPQKQQFTKPQYEKEREQPPREKKPVAQVLRKYRDDNEDGSITWGFENDDGTFKEETIGTDCVTRGKYGYIDPDGVRREYSYSSGILCDKTKDNEEAASNNEGYIDYQNNRYVLPNGDTVDLDKMVKNRARKPVYRN